MEKIEEVSGKPLPPTRNKLGLALSGGGYRAAAFHLGTLRKLHQMKMLDKVDVLSTVSGGSIVGADYALSRVTQTSYPEFEKIFITKLKKSVIGAVLTSFAFLKIVLIALIWLVVIIGFQFSAYPWVSWIVAVAGVYVFVANQFKIFPISEIIERVYDRIFFDKKILDELPDKPVMAINSTNLETGTQFTFSKLRMGDSSYEYPDVGDSITFKSTSFPVSRAVMASSCVPFAFTPVPIDSSFFTNPKDAARVHPQLIDGGIYDNQGMHKLTWDTSGYACDVVITSDAGDKMSSESIYSNVIGLLIRSMDLFMNRIKKSQIIENIYQPQAIKKREVAYISLGWDIERCIPGFVDNLRNGNILPQVLKAHQIPSEYLNPFNATKIQDYLEQKLGYQEIVKQKQSPAQLEVARNVGTNLTALSDEQINSLINQAELMTELQVKLYCDLPV